MVKSEVDSRSHRSTRHRPVGRRIGLLLAIPLLALVLLWSFAAYSVLGGALGRLELQRISDDIYLPAGTVQEAVEQERGASVAALSSGSAEQVQRLQAAQQATDAARRIFKQKSLPASNAVAGGRYKKDVRDMDGLYDQLGSLRAAVAARSMTPLDALKAYSDLFDTANRIFLRTVTVNDVATDRLITETTNVSWMLDFMLREDALVAVARSRGGRFTAAEYAAFTDSAANRRFMSDYSLSAWGVNLQASMLAIARSPQFTQYQKLEQAVSSQRRMSPAQAAEWGFTVPSLAGAISKSIRASGTVLTHQVTSAGRSVVYQLSVVGGLGLLIVIASIALSLRLVRGLSRELRELQHAAQRLAFDRLPDVVARLRRGEQVDVAEEAPPLRTGPTSEIASVAEAIGAVQRTAVETAVGESRLRSGISRVFINLAWRNQSLLQRQLRMLDEMERHVSDPDELAALFRLDHLTTRMRRHAEGLVILSGNENVRGWNEPVSVEQLVRAAVAEVEDYARVDVMALSQARVVGAVAADVVHLLAELIENATAFSPPTTEVLVRAEDVGNGLAVEVADRGVGMDADDIAEANRRLADPPEFDLADSDRLGLFVVARLAARHGIEVTLQRSAYGGIVAVALLPASLTAAGDSVPAAHRAGPADAPALVAPTGSAIGPAPEPKAPSLAWPSAGQVQLQGRHRSVDHDAPASPTPVPAPLWDDRPVTQRSEGPSAEDYDLETGGLPRRTRQANLDPHLRRSPTRRRGPARRAGHAEADPEDRTAEASRDLLSSLQAGWTAAREEDED